MSANAGRRPLADGALPLLVATFFVSTALAVIGPLIGLDEGQSAATWRDVAAWNGLAWALLLVALVWRSWAYLGWLRSWTFRSDDRLAGLVATTHEWLWESDARFILVSSGPATARLLGRPPADLVGRCMFDFVDPADVARARAAMTSALEAGVGWKDLTLTWLHADGHRVVMNENAVPVLNWRGEITGYRGAREVVKARVPTPALAESARQVQDTISRQALKVALQPIIDLTTGQWIGAEALSRFDDGTPPATAFARADEAGLGKDLELLAIRKALKALELLPAHVSLSINASPACVLDHRFVAELDEPQRPLDRLVIEITEHTAVHSYEEINEILDPLRRRGLRIGVDDTGAGYASFSHVLKLHPNIIKLDRSLIAGIDTDPARRSFVTAIVLMALDLDASVTAEGVERPEELEVLASLGIDHIQGYLLSPPTADTEQWAVWATKRWATAPSPVA